MPESMTATPTPLPVNPPKWFDEPRTCQSWLAPVDWVATAIVGYTRSFDASAPTLASAATAANCALEPERTAPNSSLLAIRTPYVRARRSTSDCGTTTIASWLPLSPCVIAESSERDILALCCAPASAGNNSVSREMPIRADSRSCDDRRKEG